MVACSKVLEVSRVEACLKALVDSVQFGTLVDSVTQEMNTINVFLPSKFLCFFLWAFIAVGLLVAGSHDAGDYQCQQHALLTG